MTLDLDLDELERYAKALDGANMITSPHGIVAPSPMMEVNPRAVLALIERVRGLEAAVPRCGCGATSSVRGDPECDGCGKDCYYCTCGATRDA